MGAFDDLMSALPPEAQALMAAQALGSGAMTGPTGSYWGFNETFSGAQIFTGTRTTYQPAVTVSHRPTRMVGPKPKGYKAPKATQRHIEESTTTEDMFSTAEEMGAKLMQMDPGERKRIQEAMFVGGFYDRGLDVTDIRWGDSDDDTLQAWNRLLMRTARHLQAGQKLTYEDVLRMAGRAGIDASRGGGGRGGGGGGGGGPTGPDVTITDPVGLAATLDETAERVLGRKSTVEEKRTFIASIHALQRQGQMMSGGEAFAPAAEARAEEMLRQQAPAEAGGRDYMKPFMVLDRMLQGLGGQRAAGG